MIDHERWLNREVREDSEIKELIGSRIESLLHADQDDGRYASVKPAKSLFSLNPQGGRVGYNVSERGRLERLGIEVMQDYGMNIASGRIDEREKGLNEKGARVVDNGAKQYMVYSSTSNSEIEFRREATYIMIADHPTDDIDQMEVNNVKWSVRYAENKSYEDVAP